MVLSFGGIMFADLLVASRALWLMTDSIGIKFYPYLVGILGALIIRLGLSVVF